MKSIESDAKKRFSYLARTHGAAPRADGHTRMGYLLRRTLSEYILTRLLPADLTAKSISFLDSGCGNGTLAPVYQQNLTIGRLDGIDYTPELAEIARAGGRYDTIVCGNVLDIDSLFAQSYDVVMSCGVYHYIDPCRRRRYWTAHVSRLLPGGRMILMGPNQASPLRRAKKLPGYYFDVASLVRDIDGIEGAAVERVCGIGLVVRKPFVIRHPERTTLKSLSAFEIGVVVKGTAPAEGR